MDLQNYLSGEYNKIYVGLEDLSRAVRDYATQLPTKLQAMEEIYLTKFTGYSGIELKQIIYFREAFSYKFHLANMHLEQLWSFDHIGSEPSLLNGVLSNIYDYHQFNHDNILLPSFAIEGFIIQGTAFLDFYMLYMCSIFKISETNYLSGKKFIKALDQIEDEFFLAKAEQVKHYFAEKVFGGSET